MRWVVGDIHGMPRPLKAPVGAAADFDPGGRLTGVCVETGNFIQVDPAGRVPGAD